MQKVDRTVVRNQAYRKAAISIRERHNERKNGHYCNPDIMPERSNLNIHFKRCEGTYAQAFDKMVADGTVSTRGLRPDAKVMDEMVFDVNTAYFDRHGGYEYAKRFFTETYRIAADLAGGEQYILSAVMHADERNKSLSKQLGRDVFHYHLHVVYVPVVSKEIRWSKRCKDKSLVGTVKETIRQVSHSKKWSARRKLDERGRPFYGENGKPVLLNMYSALQDYFFNQIQAAGYTDLERGQRASTAEHLSVLDYKIRQDQQQADGLDIKIQQMDAYLAKLEQRSKTVKSSSQQINGMARPALLGSRVTLEPEDWNKVKALAKETLVLRGKVFDQKRQIGADQKEIQRLRQQQPPSMLRLMQDTEDYQRAMRYAPERVQAFVRGILAEVRDKSRERRLERPQGRSYER
ncbi:plasmid recombination protein [Ethanoligenens sp.]|uniref:plasmid recombination protein n=1 Tax=Ethanoligenens sp. TaxID=2099655 RepID=UPI0039E82687